MAKPILVANWKSGPGSLLEAKFLLRRLGKRRLLYKKLSLFIAAPLPYFEAVSSLAGGFARLASQDISLAGKGEHTGEVGPEILKSFGVRLSILGHSERRALGESAAEVAAKVKAALNEGIIPLVCFGEPSRDADGEHFEFLRQELKALVGGLGKREAARIMLAYEPVWAIGKQAKDAIEVQELAQTVVFIRKVLSDLFGRHVAETVPILYGGSAEPDNAGLLFRNSGIRGLLVGHASLEAKSFEGIARSIIER